MHLSMSLGQAGVGIQRQITIIALPVGIWKVYQISLGSGIWLEIPTPWWTFWGKPALLLLAHLSQPFCLPTLSLSLPLPPPPPKDILSRRFICHKVKLPKIQYFISTFHVLCSFRRNLLCWQNFVKYAVNKLPKKFSAHVPGSWGRKIILELSPTIGSVPLFYLLTEWKNESITCDLRQQHDWMTNTVLGATTWSGARQVNYQKGTERCTANIVYVTYRAKESQFESSK